MVCVQFGIAAFPNGNLNRSINKQLPRLGQETEVIRLLIA